MRLLTKACLWVALSLCGCKRPAQPRDEMPDASAICSAASSTTGDTFERFVRAVPVEMGGSIYDLRGSRETVSSVVASQGLAHVVLAPCPSGDRVVAWVPGVQAPDHGDDPLAESFQRAGLPVNQHVTFAPAPGREWLRNLCRDHDACCRRRAFECHFLHPVASELAACMTEQIGLPGVESCAANEGR